MILCAGYRVGCCFVAGFVAGKSTALLFRKPLILGEFCYCLYFYDNESNEKFKKNKKTTIAGQILDYRFYAVRCWTSLPCSFVCLFHLWRQMLMQRDSEKKKERQERWKKVQFIVTREFSGSQTMQEAFEQLIERQACGQFEEWLGRKAG